MAKDAAKNAVKKEAKKAAQREAAKEATQKEGMQKAAQKEATQKAVLIECNYPWAKRELKGSASDILRVRSWLTNEYSFCEKDITILLDTNTNMSSIKPTAINILWEILSLVQNARPNDVLLVYYCGHGYNINDDKGNLVTGIVPIDRQNPISGKRIMKIINKVPTGCLITVVADCCFSGGLIKCAKKQTTTNTTKESSLLTLLTASTSS